MAVIEKRTIEIIKAHVTVEQADIDDGVSCDPARCMEKLATTRALSKALSLGEREIKKLHVRVKGSGIRFNYNGYRWHSPTPQKAINALIRFDNPKTRSLVRPHNYTIRATKQDKVIPFTRERQEQINVARRARARAGRPDRIYNGPTIHDRITGETYDARADNSGKKAA